MALIPARSRGISSPLIATVEKKPSKPPGDKIAIQRAGSVVTFERQTLQFRRAKVWPRQKARSGRCPSRKLTDEKVPVRACVSWAAALIADHSSMLRDRQPRSPPRESMTTSYMRLQPPAPAAGPAERGLQCSRCCRGARRWQAGSGGNKCRTAFPSFPPRGNTPRADCPAFSEAASSYSECGDGGSVDEPQPTLWAVPRRCEQSTSRWRRIRLTAQDSNAISSWVLLARPAASTMSMMCAA